MTLTANLRERMETQTAERRETGRPLRRGDVVHDEGHGYRVIQVAMGAGDFAEALVERDIRARRTERPIG